MSKKWCDLLRKLIIVLAAGAIFVVVLSFFVAWIAWRSGVPIPVN